MQPVRHYRFFLSAILNADGTVNMGYYILWKLWKVYLVFSGITVALVAYAVLKYAASLQDILEVMKTFALVVGGLTAAIFTTALTGVGIYLWGDSRTAQTPPTAPHVIAPAAAE